jgi:hypothetical protein
MESQLSYFDYAEADFQVLEEACQSDIRGNLWAGVSQNICERYFKHLIDQYVGADDEAGLHRKIDILHTHSLTRLLNYLVTELPGFSIGMEDNYLFRSIDGFYFSTRYPGEDHFLASSQDIDLGIKAAKAARRVTIDYMKLREQENMI